MEEARAQALAQLQNPAAQAKPSGGPKGPRRTYETSTSGPSFGHILHQDGRPMRLSGPPLPPGQAQSVPMARDIGGQQPFMRIPFGVPMGASIQRPLFVMRNSAGVGMGVGLGGQGLQGSGLAFGGPPHGMGSHAERTKDARSAYVETIEDASHFFRERLLELTSRNKLRLVPIRLLPEDPLQRPYRHLPNMIFDHLHRPHTKPPLELRGPLIMHNMRIHMRIRTNKYIRACPTGPSEPKLDPHTRLPTTSPDLQRMLSL
jgi:hypothetical protein